MISEEAKVEQKFIKGKIISRGLWFFTIYFRFYVFLYPGQWFSQIHSTDISIREETPMEKKSYHVMEIVGILAIQNMLVSTGWKKVNRKLRNVPPPYLRGRNFI